MGWALHQGLKCLLIKSQLRLEPALPPASPRPAPRDATHSPLQGGPLGCHSAQPTASRGKHEQRKTGRRAGPAQRPRRQRQGGRAGGRIPLPDNKGDRERLLCWVLGQASHPSEPQFPSLCSGEGCSLCPTSANETMHRKGLVPRLAESGIPPMRAAMCVQCRFLGPAPHPRALGTRAE